MWSQSSAIATLALLAVLLPTLIGSAAAAPEVANATTTPQDTERIDDNTVLIEASYNEQSGMVSVTVRSDRPQAITVTDAGALMQGGEIPQRTVAVDGGETATIKVPATEVQGWVGVSIKTDETLYGVPITGFEANTLSFVDRLTSPQALATGAVSMAIWMVVAGVYVLWIEGGEPEVA